MKLYCFNPEHDLAIANGSENFQAPESAVLLATDLSLLPAWFADEGSMVISEQTFAPDIRPSGLNIKSVNPYSEDMPAYCTVEPWGWDVSVRKRLASSGIDMSSMPGNSCLDIYRGLSHRRTASFAMEYIRERMEHPELIPNPAIELNTETEINRFAAEHEEVVLKSPWSGSGKGVFWSKGPLTQSLSGWCRRVLDKQGCVMGELAMNRIQDFAIEYRVMNGKTTFAGYSLFITESSGIYRGNRLMSNDTIEHELQRWVDTDYLRWLRGQMLNFIDERIAPYYTGYVGADMFIYRDGEHTRINPAVEINLRMTMGMAARIIYDRYVHPGSNGWFYIDHEPPGQLLTDHTAKCNNEPMQLAGGRLSNGYLSLCPVLPNTVYRASILLTPNH